MSLRKTVLVCCGTVLLSVTVHAQINIDQLGAARAYDEGVLQSGGLDSELWQGVSAMRATALIENIDTSAKGSARDLIRAALLSGGVPPQAGDSLERETYIAARLSAVLGLGDLSAFNSIASQSGMNRASPTFMKIFTERALLGGDINTACTVTDNNSVERKSSYWAKMRAFCHVVRNEIPAAELTVDLLIRSGHKDVSFFSLLNALTAPSKTEKKINFASDIVKTPLDTALARLLFKKQQIDLKILPPVLAAEIALDIQQKPADRLTALLSAVAILNKEQIRKVLVGLAEEPFENPEDAHDSDNIHNKKVWDYHMWGGAYYMLRGSDNTQTATLAGELFLQAEKNNILADIARALEPNIAGIPVEFQAKHHADIFAHTAVLRGDIGTLSGLFQALGADDPLQARIALASDALGNGFMLGELGVGIETRLAGKGKLRTRAVRDVFIAVAMGANLSDDAEKALRDTNQKGRRLNPGALLALQVAARRGSKAEVALRVAHMIDGKQLQPASLAALLSTMISAGMYEQAGRLAALDYIEDD